MNGSFLFRELLLAIFIIVLVFWIWRWFRGTAGSWRGWVTTLVAILLLSLFAPWMWQKISEGGITTYGFGKSSQYVWTWELPRGYYVRGLNKGGPMVAEIIPCSDGALWINTFYNEHGVPDVTRIRLTKVEDNSWEGTWEQDNPEDHGRCELRKVASDTWAGTMTGKEEGVIPPAFCTLKRK